MFYVYFFDDESIGRCPSVVRTLQGIVNANQVELNKLPCSLPCRHMSTRSRLLMSTLWDLAQNWSGLAPCFHVYGGVGVIFPLYKLFSHKRFL